MQFSGIGPDWKWFNIQSFFERLLSRDDVLSVKMFSAMIDPGDPASDARERQERYFAALKTLPKVRLILGSFQPREVTCKADCKLKYRIQDEKKTDVNIAVEMISDSLSDECEKMCIVSGDSDIQPAVEWICKRRSHIKIFVYIPALPNQERDRRLDYYLTQRLLVECKFLPLETIKDHQLPPTIKVQHPELKILMRPHIWK